MTTAQQLTPREFKLVTGFIYERTGIYIPEEKLALVSNRLRKRLRALKLPGFMAYYDLMTKGGSEFEEEFPHFLSAVTTNETYFFRNVKLWEMVSGELLDDLLELKAKQKSIAVWSAACSSGAEAYSVAICLNEQRHKLRDWKLRIVGTDISSRVLDIAREGIYNEYAVSKCAPERIRTNFKQLDADRYQLRADVRSMAEFKFHNLRDSMKEKFDFVLLRNVMMYFDTPMKIKVVRSVAASMNPGGILYAGDVDPIRSTLDLNEFPQIEYVKPFIYRRTDAPSTH
ncbi:MAG: chemotaxis protein methyltransferase [Phycisphaerae bacterium]|nr:MAG: chemotaxis protein methyltransferase [Phycisphaerae bacterium]